MFVFSAIIIFADLLWGMSKMSAIARNTIISFQQQV